MRAGFSQKIHVQGSAGHPSRLAVLQGAHALHCAAQEAMFDRPTTPSASKLPSICGCQLLSLLRGQFLAKSATTDFRSAERVAEVDGYESAPLYTLCCRQTSGCAEAFFSPKVTDYQSLISHLAFSESVLINSKQLTNRPLPPPASINESSTNAPPPAPLRSPLRSPLQGPQGHPGGKQFPSD